MEQVVYTKDGGLGWIRLVSATMSPDFNREFLDCLELLEDDPKVRVILIQGSGDKLFFAGYNLSLFQQSPSLAEVKGNVLETQQVINRVEECIKPVIAVVNGYALGAGFEMVLACDLVLAADDAMFGFPEVKVGILPAAGGTMRLPRSAGKCRAMEMILTGAKYSARDVLEMGLINRVLPREQLEDEARKIAENISANAPLAVRAAKRVILYWEALLNKQVELITLERTVECLLSEDLQEGVKAFLEKRTAHFNGR